jgi:hypothetical protein
MINRNPEAIRDFFIVFFCNYCFCQNMVREKTLKMCFVNKYGLIVLFYFKVARVILELIGI